MHSELSVRFSASDTFLLRTDGITEAANAQGEQFGNEKVREVLSANRSATSEDLCTSLFTAVWSLHGSAELAYDVTAACVRV